MNNYLHHTTPTQFVEATGIRFGYRRFANRRLRDAYPRVAQAVLNKFMVHSWLTGRRTLECPHPVPVHSLAVDAHTQHMSAWCALRPGLKPYQEPLKSTS